MNRAADLRLPSIDEEIDAGHMPVFETEIAGRFGNGGEVAAIDGEINVARHSSGKRIPLLHVKENGYTTNDTVLDSGP